MIKNTDIDTDIDTNNNKKRWQLIGSDRNNA